MIAFVRGTVCSITKDTVIVDNHGIGYLVYVSDPTKIALNREVTLYTYQHVREDAILLFGFLSMEEHDVFLQLISVKGVGPKTALTMLGVCPVKEMISAIENNDVAALKKLPGIGAKTAQQIVLDLRGKLVEEEQEDVQPQNSAQRDAVDALKALGYKQSEINSIKREWKSDETKSVDEYIRQALVLLAKRKGV